MPQFDTGSDLKAEFDSLRPGESTEQGATRRTALKAAIGVGYAAATLPIAAQTAIKTSADGLKAGPIKYKVNGFDVPAYAAAPAGKTDLPVVLVMQEIFGVHEYIADTCRRFAKAGYLAIAPELYARQGDPRSYTDIPKLQAEVVSKVPDAQVMADLDGALQLCGRQRRRRRTRPPSPASAGAAASSGSMRRTGKVKAGVAWYGRLVGQPSELHAQAPDRRRRRAQGAGARPLRRQGPGHPA